MKPALVLGLALATNAMAADQADNELIMAPTDKFSRDLAQRFHGKIMFDDELFAQYPPVELFGSYEEWLRTTRNYRASRDDAADDELALKIVHLPPSEHVAYDDDELLVRPLVPHIAADDDEFAVILRSRDSFKNEEDYQKYFRRAFVTYDDAADDELGLRIVHRSVTDHPTFAFDDDELRIRPISVLPESVAADDELSFMPIPPKVFVKSEWFKTTKTTPEALIRDDEADDELAFTVRAPRVVVDKSLIKPVKNTASEALVRDDEADDELLYLGQLIQDRAWMPRTFDDELRAEKPSHVKAEERAQLKSELLKKPRKLRPRPDVIPMAQN